ncbi:hypothetical protein tb265_20580 [Gemmatimonadetes bacterium T265]|nr:hypothetical protein tb265_20580 [Gemmatimonadetes bacterium T265]
MNFARSIDVAQVAIYAFWLFFAGLVYYLRREDKREGYPMVSDGPGGVIQGFPRTPGPKRFIHRPAVADAPSGSSVDTPADAAASSAAPPVPPVA